MSRSPLRACLIAGAAFALLALAAPAGAEDLPRQVRKAFGGSILFSADALPAPDPEDPGATVKRYRKSAAKSLRHEEVGGVPTWNFHFMAFMKRKPESKQVSLDFYTADGEKLFVAQKRLTGINPRLTLLSSQVRLTEDDGLSTGKRYVVKLTSKVRGKEVVLATGTVATN